MRRAMGLEMRVSWRFVPCRSCCALPVDLLRHVDGARVVAAGYALVQRARFGRVRVIAQAEDPRALNAARRLLSGEAARASTQGRR